MSASITTNTSAIVRATDADADADADVCSRAARVAVTLLIIHVIVVNMSNTAPGYRCECCRNLPLWRPSPLTRAQRRRGEAKGRGGGRRRAREFSSHQIS